jgi:hypothetical protein
MPGSIHLPGWVGLLLERRRTGLRVESLTPQQSSVSAGGVALCESALGDKPLWIPAKDAANLLIGKPQDATSS